MNDLNILLQQAINEIEYLNEDEEFLLRDLYKGYEWNRISIKYRHMLGALFLDHITNNKIHINAVRKTSSKQQIYKKEFMIYPTVPDIHNESTL